MTNLKFKRTITYTLKLLSLIKRLQPISLLLIAVPLKAEVTDTRASQKWLAVQDRHTIIGNYTRLASFNQSKQLLLLDLLCARRHIFHFLHRSVQLIHAYSPIATECCKNCDVNCFRTFFHKCWIRAVTRGIRVILRGRKKTAAGFFTSGKPEDYWFCGVISTNAFNGSTVLIFRTGRKMTPSHAISLGSVLILSTHKKLATLVFFSHLIHIKKGTHSYT